MKVTYNLNQLAMITEFTTRTLRNHLKQGILNGEKIEGVWNFTEKEVDDYLGDFSVKQAIASNHHAVIYVFLSDSFKKTNRICTIMDCPVSQEEAISIAKFFSTEITEHGTDIQFRFINERFFSRFILAGSEQAVADLMKAYYEK